MTKPITLKFTIVAPGCLRMVVSHTGGPIIDIVEINPRADGAYAPCLGAIDVIGGDKSLTIVTSYPFSAGRSKAPKTLIKRAIEAAVMTEENEHDQRGGGAPI